MPKTTKQNKKIKGVNNIELGKEESDLYIKIALNGNMDEMFTFGMSMGLKLAKKTFDNVSVLTVDNQAETIDKLLKQVEDLQNGIIAL